MAEETKNTKKRYYRAKKNNTEAAGKKQNNKNQQIKASAGNKKGGAKNQNNAPQKNKQQNQNKKHSAAPKIKKADQKIKVIPLGGLGEVGKNMTLIEYENEIICVDAGMSFPSSDMPGIDYVIPDFTYLEKNFDKFKAIILTHGHEDHIGGIPFVLKKMNVPIYGTSLTIGFVRNKLDEHKLSKKAKLNVVKAGDTIRIGSFSIEFIHTNHSIPEAVALAITTPAGLLVFTGDFKIDSTPIDGDMIDLGRFGELGKKGVLALFSDSTNAEREGFTASERTVGDTFRTLFKGTQKRIIVATFASNIHRLQQIMDAAALYDRKVAVSGRSMLSNIKVAIDLGIMTVPENTLIDIKNIKKYTDDQIVLITTGSQGEPMSALARMASDDHKKVGIGPNDMVIISATPIPGNEKTVSKVINELLMHGAEVVYERLRDIHVSGHACQEELKIMIAITKPKFFVPIHGEIRQTSKHAGLARQIGYENKNIIMLQNGSVLELSPSRAKITGTVPSGVTLVDGLGIGDVGNIVLRERKLLSEDGVIIVVTSIDGASGLVVSGPEIFSRGFVYVRDSEDLMDGARRIIETLLEKHEENFNHNWASIKSDIKDTLSSYVYTKTKRTPMIIPILMEV